MSAVTLAALLLMGTVIYNGPMKSYQLAQTLVHTTTPGGVEAVRPTMANQIWIDTPQNTVHRNDAVGGHPDEIESHLKQLYAAEAAVHPGVRLVAGTVVA